MKLIKARIRGLGTLAESQWFELSPHLNLFQFPDRKGLKHGSTFLQTLQTINPNYLCQTVKPYADFPQITEQGGHLRRVNPTKRTVALAVFEATPKLVEELTTEGDWFYETDRIEVGRRLDYSRWINFVELASSTRWSEISTDMQTLVDDSNRLNPDLATPLADLISLLRPSDRIRDELQYQLTQWLRNLPQEIRKKSQQLIEKTITAVMRAEHFQAARNIVRRRLPLFVIIGRFGDFPDSQRDAIPANHLLNFISDRAKHFAKEQRGAEQTFFDALNEQLATLHYSDMVLQIDRSQTEVLLMMNEKPFHIPKKEPLALLRQMQAKACLAIATSRVVYKTEPIILFDAPEQALPDTLHGVLADFVIDIANTCQCLYSFCDVDIFPDDVVGRRYNAAELFSTSE